MREFILGKEDPRPAGAETAPLIVFSNNSQTNKASKLKLDTTLRASIFHAQKLGHSSNGAARNDVSGVMFGRF